MRTSKIDHNRSISENCTAHINDLYASRRVVTNPAKTKLIWYGTKTSLYRINVRPPSTHISPYATVRDLGVILDLKLDFHTHTLIVPSQPDFTTCDVFVSFVIFFLVNWSSD